MTTRQLILMQIFGAISLIGGAFLLSSGIFELIKGLFYNEWPLENLRDFCWKAFKVCMATFLLGLVVVSIIVLIELITYQIPS